MDATLANQIIYGFEIVILIVTLIMLTVGLLQNKKSQSGLSSLSGGNDELFAVLKERGLDRFLSIVMLVLGILLFSLAILVAILNNTLF
ncbi:preprotein translocase subunit SecG [Spiroplasma endosymbiont of Anurida maritima]|uniref:preprotein translocase subunit SecG n=1 Tax=Spiroplasma endosymbiont of Anurida maritima TaxID=2967972 RepID=UPI0036D292FA